MPRKPVRRGKVRPPRTSSPSPRGSRWSVLLPAAIAVVLCAPCVGLGYIWDDYIFLTLRGGTSPWTLLLPGARTAFYRPIPQGLYFLLLRLVDPATGVIAHLMNLAVLAGAIVLLVLLVSRLFGRRAGLISGIILASMGCMPSLAAWVSCSQDLFAIGFVLAALLLRDKGRDVPALVCAVAGVLCKEPAIAAFPVLIFWDHIVGRPASRMWVRTIAYAAVGILWIAIHPGLHVLASRGFQSGATGYVGIESPERWGRYLWRYLLALLNVPAPGFTSSWWESRVPFGLAALGILVGGLLLVDRGVAPPRGARSITLGRGALLAALFGVPTLLMPVVLIRHWAPYFACIPAVGFAMFLGPLLARAGRLVVAIVLGVFLLLGVRYRGLEAGSEPVWTERVFAEAAGAVHTVRNGFRRVLPAPARGSQVLVSVESTGARGIRNTLLEGQALRVWYRDPGLRTEDVLLRKPGVASEYLVRVTNELDVISIDPVARRAEGSRPEAADIIQVGRPLRNYARALAAAGELDRAVRAMDWLAEIESDWGVVYARRLKASFLLYAGKRGEAEGILGSAPEFPRDTALGVVRRILAEPSQSEALDDAAFEAFGLSATDPETMRWMMRGFVSDGAAEQAAWYALRLARLLPGDRESQEVIRTADQMGVKPRRAQ